MLKVPEASTRIHIYIYIFFLVTPVSSFFTAIVVGRDVVAPLGHCHAGLLLTSYSLAINCEELLQASQGRRFKALGRRFLCMLWSQNMFEAALAVFELDGTNSASAEGLVFSSTFTPFSVLWKTHGSQAGRSSPRSKEDKD